ncbi:MAG: EamA family transporter [Streptosporangiaceae bacterium]
MEANPRGGEQAAATGRFRPVGIGLACALSSGVCFSVSTVCAQKALDAGVPVVLVAGARPTIACVLLILVTATAGRQAIPGRARLRLMGVGLFTAAQIFLLYQSVERISAPLAVLLLYSYPALVAVLCMTFLRERPGPVKLAAVAVSLGGAVLIVGAPVGRANTIGFACGLGAGLCLAIYIVLSSRATRGIKPFTAVTWIQAGAGLVYLPALAATATSRAAPAGLGWLLPVGLSAGLATALFLTSLQRLGPTTASVASTIEPVSTALLSAAVLGITLTDRQAYGGLLIVGALVLISLDGTRRRRAPVSSP